jgi:transposase-like protein
MKGKKHHSAGQIIRKLEEAEVRLSAGQAITQVCQALEVAESTFHRWRNQYGGMKAEEAKRCLRLPNAYPIFSSEAIPSLTVKLRKKSGR